MKSHLLIYIGIAVFFIVSLFFIFKPQTQKINTTTTNPLSSKKQTVINKALSPAPIQSNKKVFNLVIKEKKIVSGDNTLKVTQSNAVTIHITSDEPEELHIHGYNNSVELEPGTKATLTFTADKSGRFPFELEASQTELGSLDVQPK